MTNLVLSRRGFLAGLGSLLAAPAVVRAEALVPIVPWGPTFWCMHGGGMLACRDDDLVGVDLASLGLPGRAGRPAAGASGATQAIRSAADST